MTTEKLWRKLTNTWIAYPIRPKPNHHLRNQTSNETTKKREEHAASQNLKLGPDRRKLKCIVNAQNGAKQEQM